MLTERFIAGEDIKEGDVLKYEDQCGVIRFDSFVVDNPVTGRHVVRAPRVNSAPTSPYNAKPVPRFEVTPCETMYGFFIKLFAGGGALVDIVGESDRRGWFRRESWEDAISRKQYEMAMKLKVSLRLSGSAETLTGVKLV